MKTITIQVPDDCEVQIVKKEEKKEPVIRTYQDLIDNKVEITGCYIDTESSNIMSLFVSVPAEFMNRDVAASEKVAKSMLAMAMISQLIPYYGEEITDEEWNDENLKKYVIGKQDNETFTDYAYGVYFFLAFHTQEQRDNFLKYNEQLVKDYLMID